MVTEEFFNSFDSLVHGATNIKEITKNCNSLCAGEEESYDNRIRISSNCVKLIFQKMNQPKDKNHMSPVIIRKYSRILKCIKEHTVLFIYLHKYSLTYIPYIRN